MRNSKIAPVRLKLCYVLDSLQYGGTEGRVLELIRRLDPERFECSLILERDDHCGRADGLDVRVGILQSDSRRSSSTPKRIYNVLGAFRKFCGYLSEFRPNIVHASLPVPCILAANARLLGMAPLLVASRTSLVDSYRPNQRLGALADHIATRSADLVLGNCQAIIQEVIALDGVAPSRTELIYNGVDTNRFSRVQSKRLRLELGWSSENLVFGMVANFLPYKRHLDFVHAAAIVKAAFPIARFLLVGEDRGQMRVVENALKEAGLDDCVKILGRTSAPELAFAAMDVYVCTSETEGFPNVLLEAMATGLPVVATDVGGNREAIGNDGCGFLVPRHSPELIAKSALDLARAPELRGNFSENARRRAETLFSMDRMVREYEHTYIRLSSERQGSPWARLI